MVMMCSAAPEENDSAPMSDQHGAARQHRFLTCVYAGWILVEKYHLHQTRGVQ